MAVTDEEKAVRQLADDCGAALFGGSVIFKDSQLVEFYEAAYAAGKAARGNDADSDTA